AWGRPHLLEGILSSRTGLATSRCKSERGEGTFLRRVVGVPGGSARFRLPPAGPALIDASADAVARHVPGPAGCWRSRRVRPSAPFPGGLDSDTAGGHDTAWRH